MTRDTGHPHRLPWYVVGRLEPGAMAEVEAHLRGCVECREEALALSSIKETLVCDAGAGHATPREIVAHRTGMPSTPRERRADVDEHLAGCPSCRSEIGILDEVDLRDRHRARTRALGWTIAAAAGLALILLAPMAVHLRGPRSGTTIFMPSTRTQSPANVLTGAPPWHVVVALPFSAPSGGYLVQVERTDGVALGESMPADTAGATGRLALRLPSLPGPADYRLVVRSRATEAAHPYVYPFHVSTAISAPAAAPAP